jgi:cation diffusion facilitator family transporter
MNRDVPRGDHRDESEQPPAPWNGMGKSLTRFAWLSIAAALLTIGLKTGAYLITGSVGLLSDAIESLVNLAAAVMALAMLMVAERPPDEEHAYGHNKAEYFSSGFEGALILLAAATIIWSAWDRFWNPVPLEQVGIGLAVSLVASAVNLGVALTLRRAGRRYNSITLEADSKHLMTDVWTSVGVVAAVGAVWLTGWLRLDPLIAVIVALNIVWSGINLVRRSMLGLLDTSIPVEERVKVDEVLARHEREGVSFHALRTRQAGWRQFVSMHILVPGDWTVQRGHDLAEQIEEELHTAVPGIHVSTHTEPLDDPRSMEDVPLDRTFESEGQQG